MIKKLKVKIFSSFMLLVFMLLIAGVMSIWELSKMNDSFRDVIDNNYQSIEHALNVIDALEREDSGILMVYLGKNEEGSRLIHAADSTIARSMIDIRKNVTEKGEERVIRNIDLEYKTYSALLDSIISKKPTEEIEYLSLHDQFMNTKRRLYF